MCIRDRTKDRGYRWYRAAGNVKRNQAGEAIQFIGIFVDITDEHISKNQINSLLQRHSAIDHISTEGSIYIRMQRNNISDLENAVWFSEQFRKQIGFSKEDDFPNRADFWLDRIHPEDFSLFISKVKNAISMQSGLFETEYRIKHKSGKYIWIRSVIYVGKIENSGTLFFTAVTNDITELNHTRELVQQNMNTHVHSLMERFCLLYTSRCV